MQVDQIPSGYKLTEVGIIPSDWDVKKLGDITDVIMGQSPDSKNYNTQEKGVPLIQGNADIINRKSIKRVFTTEITKTCEKGDIVMTVRAPVGAIGISSDYSCIGRGVCSFKLKSVNQNYFFHLMVFYEKKCEGLGQGSTFTAVNSIDIKNIEIPLPPIEEQKRIAQVLSDIDELIRSLDELIIKKRNIKQGTMQLLLTGKQRLPGYSGEWEVKKLGEIAEIMTGSTPSTKDLSNYGDKFLFVSPADLGNKKYIFNTEKKLSEKGFKISRKFPKDSILFTCIGSTIGKLGIASFDMTSNQQINAVVPNENYSSNYLYYTLSLLVPQIRATASEQAVPIINKSNFAETVISLPLLEEQKAIARILSDMDEEIEVLEAKRDKYQDIKKGMMQELLTGKTRLL